MFFNLRLGLLVVAALAAITTVSGTSLAAEPEESRLLDNIRQLTFEGRRAGEGYFSRDGAQLIFREGALAAHEAVNHSRYWKIGLTMPDLDRAVAHLDRKFKLK